MGDYETHAFEIRQMVNNHPMIMSLAKSVFGLVKQYSSINIKNKTAETDIWWPFIKACFMDIQMYGFCAYIKRKEKGIVFPENVPIKDCHLNINADTDMIITPRMGRLVHEKNIEKKIKVYVAYAPFYDTRSLHSPLARLLHSYKRLNEMSSCYVEEERRVAKPVLFLEDTRTQENGLYQAVGAQNPDWSTSIPGLALSARDTADEHAKINHYVASLQQNMVDLINRGEGDPTDSVDSLGIRHQKRKRVPEVQVPLPSNKRAHIYQPNSRVDIIALERFFKEETPWIFGLPISFFENTTSKVSSNYKLLETIALTAIEDQVETLNLCLLQVSKDLFGMMELLINSPMRVKLTVKEDEIDYETKTPAQAAAASKSNAPAAPSSKKTESE